MIGRGEITKAAQKDGVDAQTVERDYVLAHVASELGNVAGESFLLKGGTCLRLAHYPGYRYSADLDYSVQEKDVGASLGMVEHALEECRGRAGFEHLELARQTEPLRIHYIGPLGSKPRNIKLDLTYDELIFEHAELAVGLSWRDLPPQARLHAYNLTEICAEKLRCVVQRRQCRDIYDLWSLLEDRGGADLLEAWHRFKRKAEHRDIEPTRFFDRWDEGVDWYRSHWQGELGDYLGEGCPDFVAVTRALTRRVSQLQSWL